MKSGKDVSDTRHVACAHCGLPVPPALRSADPAFCCSSCRTVHGILQDSGLDATYYRLKESAPAKGRLRPPPTGTPESLLLELDSPDFLETYAAPLDGGLYRTELYLDGVHCAACVWLVERLPQHVEGVASARLNLTRGRLALTWHPGIIALSDIARWLARFGYPVQPRVPGGAAENRAPQGASRAEKQLLIRVGVAWALAGNVMLLAFALYGGLDVDMTGLGGAARWLSMLLAVPAVAYGGSVFFQRAWASLRLAARARSLRYVHMDTPISAGILTGFAASAWATIFGQGEIWFDSITVLIAALLTARWLQLRAQRLAGDASDQLLALLPTVARRFFDDGQTERVRANDLTAGQLVRVQPGELIPVDGTVHDGESHVGHAVLTGESRPIFVRRGTAVFAGTINETSPLTVQVARTGQQTRIGSLISWVSEPADAMHPLSGRSSRPSILHAADALGGWFSISVLVLAGVSAVFWSLVDPSRAVSHVVALLVITCPCALGMATPLALAVGLGRAARRGLFIKGEAVLERATSITAVVLDKTGTITEGAMRIDAFEGAAGAMERAASVEAGLGHPIARAFSAWADGRELSAATEVRLVPSTGVEARVAGRRVRVGRPAWILETATVPENLQGAAARMAAGGRTPVAIEVDGALVAVASITDPVRSDARATIDWLSTRTEVWICSGDNEATTRHIAERVGVPPGRALGAASPENKKLLVERLQKLGHRVLVVGDGVNDTPALRAANIGLAVADGSAASRMAAHVYVTRPGLGAARDLVEHSGHVLHVVRRNLTFSLAYNVIGAGAALAGLVTPLFAAVAMPVSSFVVVLSSLHQPFSRRNNPPDHAP